MPGKASGSSPKPGARGWPAARGRTRCRPSRSTGRARHGRQPHQREDRPEHQAEDEGAQRVDDGVEERAAESLGQGVDDQVTAEEDLLDLAEVRDRHEQGHGGDEDGVLHPPDALGPLAGRERAHSPRGCR